MLDRVVILFCGLLIAVTGLERCSDPLIYSNFLSFAVVNADGSVSTWGNQFQGGDFSPANISKPVEEIIPSKYGYAAVSSDRSSVFTWGASFGDQKPRIFESSVKKVVSNLYSFAALLEDGSVEAWGDSRFGGSTSAVEHELVEVEKIDSNCCAFLALRSNGTVVAWGSENEGGKLPGNFLNEGIATIRPTERQFVVERRDGSVDCIGTVSSGTDCSSFNATAPIQFSAFNYNANAMIDANKTLIAWGDRINGGDSSTVRFSGLPIQLVSNSFSFALLTDDGTVATWGNPNFGGVSPSHLSEAGCVKIFAISMGYACLTGNGTVETWGSIGSDGEAPGINETVVDIFTTTSSFAALTSGGSVLAWGQSSTGGSLSNLDIDKQIGDIISTSGAFFALATDGSAFAWGEFNSGGNFAGFRNISKVRSIATTYISSAILMENDELVTIGYSAGGGGTRIQNVEVVSAAGTTLAAIKKDGSLIAFGNIAEYSNANFSGSFTQLKSNTNAFSAIKTDGSILSFGLDSYGGKYEDGLILPSKASKIYSNKGAFAVLLDDYSVFCFGQKSYGGDCSQKVDALQDVQIIYNNAYAFAAVTTSDVVTWGDNRYGGNSDGVNFTGGVSNIFSTDKAFAAIKSTDSLVVVWGDSSNGGYLEKNLTTVKDIQSNTGAFAVVLDDGQVYSWGSSFHGGDTSAFTISGNVVELLGVHGGFVVVYDTRQAMKWGSYSYTISDVEKVSAAYSSLLFLTTDNYVTFVDDENVYRIPPKSSKRRVAIRRAHEDNYIVESEDGSWEVVGSTSTVYENSINVSCPMKFNLTASPTASPTFTPTSNPTDSPTHPIKLPTSSPTQQDSKENASGEDSTTGMIVGITVPAVVIAVAVAGFLIWKRPFSPQKVSEEIEQSRV